MRSQLWRFAVLVSRLLEDQAERDAVLGDLQERGATAHRTLFEVVALVSRRQVRHLRSWQLWLTAAVLFVPVLAVVSPAFTLGLTVFHTEAPVGQSMGQSAMSILLGGAVGTAVLAWATGFAAGRLAKRRYPVILLLVTLAIALLLDRANGSIAGGANSFLAQAAALILLAGIPAGHGLWIGVSGNILPSAALVIVGVSGIVAVGLLVPASAFYWSDLALATALWPVLYAAAEHYRVASEGTRPPQSKTV